MRSPPTAPWNELCLHWTARFTHANTVFPHTCRHRPSQSTSRTLHLFFFILGGLPDLCLSDFKQTASLHRQANEIHHTPATSSKSPVRMTSGYLSILQNSLKQLRWSVRVHLASCLKRLFSSFWDLGAPETCWAVQRRLIVSFTFMCIHYM